MSSQSFHSRLEGQTAHNQVHMTTPGPQAWGKIKGVG